MKFISLLVVLLCCSYSNAQNPFFLGKRRTITICSSLAPPVTLTQSFQNLQDKSNPPFVVQKDWAIFPPEIEAQGQFAINNKISLVGTVSFRGLQNSSVYVSKQEPSFNSIINHIDSFAVRTNAVNLTFGIRKFVEYAPVGKYVQFDVGYSRSFLKVHTVEKEAFYQSSTELSFNVRRFPAIWKTGGNYFRGSFSYGTVTLINERFLLDYGINTSYFLGAYKYDSKYNSVETTADTDFKEVAGESINRLVLDNLRSSYLFKIYLKFGLYD